MFMCRYTIIVISDDPFNIVATLPGSAQKSLKFSLKISDILLLYYACVTYINLPLKSLPVAKMHSKSLINSKYLNE